MEVGTGLFAAFGVEFFGESEESGGGEELDFGLGFVAADESFPKLTRDVFAVLGEGKVVDDEGDGGGVEGVVQVGEGADVVFGFGDFFQDPLAVGAGKMGGVVVGPSEGRFALVVGTRKGVLGKLHFSFLFDEGCDLEGGIFAVLVGGEGALLVVVVLDPAEGFAAADGGMAEELEEVPRFADFASRDAGDNVVLGGRELLLEPAQGELDEVGGLGEGSFGEALFALVELGCEKEGFAGFLASSVVIVT